MIYRPPSGGLFYLLKNGIGFQNGYNFKGGLRVRIKHILVSLAIICVLQPVKMPYSEKTPNSVYVQQQSSNSCTLAAATMMIRSYLYQENVPGWDAVTEEILRDTAWSSEGLLWQWQWSDNDNTITVAHSFLGNLDLETIEQLLNDHKEGVLLYCGGNVHHGVLVTECDGQTVFCADPAMGYSGQEISLAESLLGDRLGSQENVLKSATAYWYVTSADVKVPDDKSVILGRKV